MPEPIFYFKNSWVYVTSAWVSMLVALSVLLVEATLGEHIAVTELRTGVGIVLSAPYSIFALALTLEFIRRWTWRLLALLPLLMVPWLFIFVILFIPIVQLGVRTYYLVAGRSSTHDLLEEKEWAE